jgi:hypothetical protein
MDGTAGDATITVMWRWLALFAVLPLPSALTQSDAGAAYEIISRLTYQSGRKQPESLKMGTFTCGLALAEDREDRALTKSLARLGDSALPAVEDAFQSLEARGMESEVYWKARWLLLAYARIYRAGAYSRLRGMYGYGNPNQFSTAAYVDDAVTLAFGLTSYVSAFRAIEESKIDELGVPTVHCDRGQQPKDTLDRFVLAWEVRNRKLLGETLGRNAKYALDQMPIGVLAPLDPSAAIGYRLLIEGAWSEPDETLQELPARAIAASYPDNPVILVAFKNRRGADCGKFSVSFLSIREGPGFNSYLIDDSNLLGLLRLLSACAGAQ